MPQALRVIALQIAVVTAAVALSGCGSTSTAVSAGLPCAPQPHGSLCIKVLPVNHAVGDVIAYLAASQWPLADRTWRLALTEYGCDPGTQAQPSCRASGTYPGPARHGPPPRITSCRANGTVVTAPSGCHDTLAQELASFGDFAGFYRFGEGKPHTFTSRVWLCVSEQVRLDGFWRPAVRGVAPTPLRACAAVSPA